MFAAIEHIDDQAERLSAALATVFGGMYRRMILSFGPFYRLPLPSHREFDRALADLHLLVDEVVAERRAGQKPDDLLTALLEAKDENGEPVDDREVHDQVVAILTPGSETVGSTVMWILQLLAEHPEHADRVSEEVKSVVGDRAIAFGDLRKLTHTNNVVIEALRLRPAVCRLLTRRAMAETELGGYRIPAGADIVYSPQALQRDPRSYQQHLDFDPDRWLPGHSEEVPKYAMSPFSAGNRKCPADHFSVAELGIILATVIPRWRFERLRRPTSRPGSASPCGRSVCC